MSDIQHVIKRVKKEVAKRFPNLQKDFKDDLVQEGISAYLEAKMCSSEKIIYWVIVRAISDYYWSNVSIVKRKRVPRKKPNKVDQDNIHTQNFPKDICMDQRELDAESSTIFLDESFELISKRAAKELLLVPSAKKILKEREWIIIEARVLSTNTKTTRSQMAKKLNISVERVRQIENQGLSRLGSFLSNPKSPLKILHPNY